MDAPKHRLETRTEAEVKIESSHTQQSRIREFGSVEAILREDAAGQAPPPELEHRVAHSIRRVPGAKGSWWARWFGGAGGCS